MTSLTRPVIRESAARMQGRTLIVELLPHEVIVRRKGTRLRYAVPIEALWSVGAKIAAREAAAEKRKLRGK